MHDMVKRLHGGQRGKGTTIDHFRLNEMVSQMAVLRWPIGAHDRAR